MISGSAPATSHCQLPTSNSQRDESALDRQRPETTLELCLEQPRVVDQVAAAGGHGALHPVHADDSVGDHPVGMQVRVVLAAVGLDADGCGVPVAADGCRLLAIALMSGAPWATRRMSSSVASVTASRTVASHSSRRAGSSQERSDAE